MAPQAILLCTKNLSRNISPERKEGGYRDLRERRERKQGQSRRRKRGEEGYYLS